MNGLIDLFIPKERKFFEYLQEQINILEQCINKLIILTKKSQSNNKQLNKCLTKLKKLNISAQILSNKITGFLHQTFITPIDREDIQAISLNLNRVISSVEKIVATIICFRIKNTNKFFSKQLRILEKMVDTLKSIFKNPLSIKENRSLIDKVILLEKEADAVYTEGMTDLFKRKYDAIEIIKLKELYDITEDAIDEIKYIADIMETVLITHG